MSLSVPQSGTARFWLRGHLCPWAGWGGSLLFHVALGVALSFVSVRMPQPAPPKPPDSAPILAIALVPPRQPTPRPAEEADPPPPEPMDVAVQPFVPPRIEPPPPEQPPPPDPPEAPALVSPFRQEPVAFEPVDRLKVDLCLRDVPLPEPKVAAPPKPEPPPCPPRPPEPEPVEVAHVEAQEEPVCEEPGEERAAVLSPVAVTTNPPPPYPQLARRRGYEGLVVLRVRVSPTGLCLAVEVKESSGHDVLDEAAVAAVRGWRFRPATSDGAPVEAEVDVPIRFELTG